MIHSGLPTNLIEPLLSRILEALVNEDLHEMASQVLVEVLTSPGISAIEDSLSVSLFATLTCNQLTTRFKQALEGNLFFKL